MSTRLLSAKGLKANATVGNPVTNMKWVVKWVVAVLHTGATSGTRSVQVVVSRVNNPYNAGPNLAYTSQTATSTDFTAAGDVSGDVNATSSIIWQAFPEVFAVDVINLLVTLVSGDTVDYYILVEEVST